MNERRHAMQDELHAKPLFPSQRGEGRIVKLQQGTSALFTQPGPNPSNDNSSIVLTYQVGLPMVAVQAPKAASTLPGSKGRVHRARLQKRLCPPLQRLSGRPQWLCPLLRKC